MASDPDRKDLASITSSPQLTRVESLLASVRDLVSSLSRMSAQLEREVAHALREQSARPQAAGGHASSEDALSQKSQDMSAELSALALENAQLKQALQGRPVIEQAKGMLMSRHGCDADGAFHLLVMASRRDQRKVREVAVDVVAAVTQNGRSTEDLGVSIVRHPAGTARPAAAGSPSGGTPSGRVPVPGRATPANVTPPRRVSLPPDTPVEVRPR